MKKTQNLPFDARTAGIILGWLEASDAHEVMDDDIFELDLYRVSSDALAVNGKGILVCSPYSEDHNKFRRDVVGKFEDSKKGAVLAYGHSWIYAPDDGNNRILNIPPQDGQITDAPLELIIQLLEPKNHGKSGFNPTREDRLLDNIESFDQPEAIKRMVKHVPSIAYLRGLRENPELVYNQLLGYMQRIGRKNNVP